MIPAGVQVYVASTPVDFRKGADGSDGAGARWWGRPIQRRAVRVPFETGRSDQGGLVDGSGVCLFAKTLEETKFCWPKIAPTRVQLNHAQLLALIDGLDWTKVRPVVVKRPQSVG